MHILQTREGYLRTYPCSDTPRDYADDKYKYTNTQINKHEYTNANLQIQIYKYKYANLNILIQIYKYKPTNTNIHIQVYKHTNTIP